MDSESVLEYNYIPLQNPVGYFESAVASITTAGITASGINKNFGIIISKAAANTTLLAEW